MTLEKRALSCSVREENKAQRESYCADWTSVRLRTQPEERKSVNMRDVRRKETLSRQWRASPLTQCCPSGVVRVGTVERGVREHQLLPRRNTLPLPIFTPAELGVRLGRGAPHRSADAPFAVAAAAAAAAALDGLCPAKRSVVEITRELPPVKPTLMEFSKAPKALGRSTSQEAQRG
ncbi:telethonin [Stigmatopora nigra]